MKYKYLIWILLFFNACSTQKNTSTTRFYHNLTSHYNIYFNGIESYRKGIKKAENERVDNYSQILPLFLYTDKSVSQSVTPDMDRAAKKATKVITLHSITAKPELKRGPQSQKEKEFYNQKEFNKWMDENYLLLGISYVYKNEFDLASETFKHIISVFPHTTTRYDAYIWLARCYMVSNEYRETEKILAMLESDEKIPARLKEDFYKTYSDFYLKEKKYDKAIQMLEKTLDCTKRKNNRIRYTFILAQLYQETGDLERAAENYKKVIKLNPPYEMTFNAKIKLAGSFDATKEEGKEIRALLNKMLKDNKNREFEDQIYYALGQIALKENNIDEAIELFKMSTSKSTSNLNQKGITYLTMGDLYYNKHDYLKAKLYYDSTLQSLDNNFESYGLLNQKSRSLTKLVDNLSVYQLEDSVQILAKMTDSERKEVIDKIIAEVIRKEQEALKKEQAEESNIQFGLMNQNLYRSRNTEETTGKWYFYNLNAKSFGQPEFRMIWGNRKLEDNWRRKNKQTVEIFESNETKMDQNEETSAVTGKITDTKSQEYYLKNIPLTEEALEKSHARLKEALYNVGVIYCEELKDTGKAVISFRQVTERYPNDKFALLSYYQLHEIFNKKKDYLLAEEYKNQLVSKFPDSPMAQILSNPEYLKQLQEKEIHVTKMYEDIYSRYNAGDYQFVVTDVNRILSDYPGNIQTPKLLLLKALSLGQLQGKERMKTELDTIVKTFLGHEIGIYAQELIDYIYSQAPEIRIADLHHEAEQLYSFNPGELHYLVVSVSKKADINQLNFNLINFNLDNYNKLNLGISIEESGDIQLLKVGKFLNAELIKGYRDKLLENTAVFKGFDKNDYTLFLISESNFKRLLEDKDISKYYLYYKEKY